MKAVKVELKGATQVKAPPLIPLLRKREEAPRNEDSRVGVKVWHGMC